MSGNEYLGFNNATFLSEKEAADRNYAIAYYLKEYKCFPKNAVLKDIMDFYFQVGLVTFVFSGLSGSTWRFNYSSLSFVLAVLAGG